MFWLAEAFFSFPVGTFKEKSIKVQAASFQSWTVRNLHKERQKQWVNTCILNRYTIITLELMLRPGIQAPPGLVAVLLTSLDAAMCTGVLQQTILSWCPTASSWLLQTASTVSLSHIGGTCWPMDILLLIKSLQFSCSS